MLEGLMGIGIGVLIVITIFTIWQFIEYKINRLIVGEYKYVADTGFIITLIIILVATLILLRCVI